MGDGIVHFFYLTNNKTRNLLMLLSCYLKLSSWCEQTRTAQNILVLKEINNILGVLYRQNIDFGKKIKFFIFKKDAS